MGTKELLQRPFDIAAAIERLEGDYRRCWERARSGTSRIAAVRFSGTPGRSRLEESVVRLEEIQEKLTRLYAQLRSAKRGVRGFAGQMPTADMRLLVMARFHDRKSWNDVAATLGCSVRWAHTLAGRALAVTESSRPGSTPDCRSAASTDGR
jgi:hypothetical protein